MTSTQPPTSARALWLAVFTLAAAAVGATAGMFAHAGGTSIPLSVIAGGTAFGGATGLLLAVAHYLTGPGR